MKSKVKLGLLITVVFLMSFIYLLNMPTNMKGWTYFQVEDYASKNEITIEYNMVHNTSVSFGTVINNERLDTNVYIVNLSLGADLVGETQAYINEFLTNVKAEGFINEIEYMDDVFDLEVPKGNAVFYEVDIFERKAIIQISRGNDPIESSISLVAVGDILLHDSVYNDARIGNGFDFSPMFEGVKNYFNHDLFYVNQETITGGVDIGLTSYPSFNSPFEITDALVGLGANMISLSNNHTLDRGEQAILNALNHYSNFDGIITAGAYASWEDRNKVNVIEKDGIKVALLSYSYGFNGYIHPAGKEYLANYFDMAAAHTDIINAKKLADIVVVAMHWGNEYQSLPSYVQVEQAQWLADQGVDIILGAHPHVLQPVDFLTGKDGNETFVMYSLGNFLSGQIGLEKNVGGALELDIVKIESVEGVNFEIRNVKLMPTFNYPEVGITNYRIVPLAHSVQADYFNAVNELMKTFTDRIEVVETLGG